MKITVDPTLRQERVTLAEKAGLRKAQEFHGARLTLKLNPAEAEAIGALDAKTLARWAGPKLKDLMAELGRAARGKADLSEVSLSRSIGSPEEAATLARRAQVFESLVNFGLAELSLAELSHQRLELEDLPEEGPSTLEAKGPEIDSDGA